MDFFRHDVRRSFRSSLFFFRVCDHQSSEPPAVQGQAGTTVEQLRAQQRQQAQRRRAP